MRELLSKPRSQCSRVERPNHTAACGTFLEIDPQRAAHRPTISGCVEHFEALARPAWTKLHDGAIADVSNGSSLTYELIKKFFGEIMREADRTGRRLLLLVEGRQWQALEKIRLDLINADDCKPGAVLFALGKFPNSPRSAAADDWVNSFVKARLAVIVNCLRICSA